MIKQYKWTFKIKLCNIKSHETIWSRMVPWDISTTLRSLKKKLQSCKTNGIKQNHLKSDYDIWDQSESKSRKNHSNSLVCTPNSSGSSENFSLLSATSPVLLQSSDLLTNFQELSTTSSSLWANAPWVIGQLSWVIDELLQVLSEVIRVSELPWVVKISRNSTESLAKSLKLSANLPWVAGERKLVRTSSGWTLREMSSKPLMADNKFQLCPHTSEF